jgi:hypothetical protein
LPGSVRLRICFDEERPVSEPTENVTNDNEKLREEAHERIEKLPAETALGNRDPEGGGEGDPKDYEGLSDRM